MQDRFTQYNLLCHAPPLKGAARRQAHRARFMRAYLALPQVQFSGRVLRALGRLLGRFFRRLWRTLLYPLLRWVGGLFAQLWQWFLHTPPVNAVRDFCRRFCRAARALPQYQFLCRVHRFLKARPTLRAVCIGLTIIAVFLPFCFGTPEAPPDTVYLVVDADGPTVYFNYPTEDYDLGILRVSSDSSGSDAQFILEDGQQVVIRHNGTRRTVTSRHETVAHLLRRCDIAPAADEMVAINVSGTMPIIHISSELHYQRSEITEVAYDTKEISNPLREKGTVAQLRAGQNGTIRDTYDDVYRMGQVVESVLIDRTDSTAVAEIVETGTLVESVPFEDKLAEVHPNRDGSDGGYLVFESGDSVIYTRKVVCNATAYYSGGEHGAAFHTATGHAVGLGIIAADPKVFPYHSHLYVSGYGFSQIEDCGNFSGNTIDVWYETFRECSYWGRRYVTCYVIA